MTMYACLVSWFSAISVSSPFGAYLLEVRGCSVPACQAYVAAAQTGARFNGDDLRWVAIPAEPGVSCLALGGWAAE